MLHKEIYFQKHCSLHLPWCTSPDKFVLSASDKSEVSFSSRETEDIRNSINLPWSFSAGHVTSCVCFSSGVSSSSCTRWECDTWIFLLTNVPQTLTGLVSFSCRASGDGGGGGVRPRGAERQHTCPTQVCVSPHTLPSQKIFKSPKKEYQKRDRGAKRDRNKNMSDWVRMF